MSASLAKPFTAEMLTQPEVIRNPYPFYDLLRPSAPVFGYRDYPPGTVPGVDTPEPAWVALSHEHVTRIALDNEVFSSRDSIQEQSEAPSLMLVNHDKPEHTRLRMIAAKAFTTGAIRAATPDVAQLVSTAMDEFFDTRPQEAVDVMDDYCAMLPARVIALLMGVPQDRDRDIRRWATAFMLSADLTPQQRQQCNIELAAFYAEHVARHVAARTRGDNPSGVLINAFLDAEVDGQRLTTDEVIRFCVTVTVAGAETTSFLLGNLFAVFADLPWVWEALQADPAKFTAVYEETLRFHGPPRLFRVALKDVTVGDAAIRRGQWVACFFGAANYDPAVFPDPYTFKLDRPNGNRQMSLGHGIHRCLGAPLARLESELTVQELLRRYSRIKRGSQPATWQGVSLLNHGPERNPVIFIRKS